MSLDKYKYNIVYKWGYTKMIYQLYTFYNIIDIIYIYFPPSFPPSF